MTKRVCALIAALLLTPALALAQVEAQASAGGGSGSGSGRASGASAGSGANAQATRATTAVAAKIDDAQSRFVRTMTNVQIELTLTDQAGSAAPEKKTVSMIVASGSWGKVRSAGSVMPAGEAPYVVDLNVDARPFVSVDGPIQLEMTLVYEPPKGAVDSRQPKQRIN
ncbi:MAG: hypothetical protein ACKOEC_17240, partial [Acidimicrobiia bacterium]